MTCISSFSFLFNFRKVPVLQVTSSTVYWTLTLNHKSEFIHRPVFDLLVINEGLTYKRRHLLLKPNLSRGYRGGQVSVTTIP